MVILEMKEGKDDETTPQKVSAVTERIKLLQEQLKSALESMPSRCRLVVE